MSCGEGAHDPSDAYRLGYKPTDGATSPASPGRKASLFDTFTRSGGLRSSKRQNAGSGAWGTSFQKSGSWPKNSVAPPFSRASSRSSDASIWSRS